MRHANACAHAVLRVGATQIRDVLSENHPNTLLPKKDIDELNEGVPRQLNQKVNGKRKKVRNPDSQTNQFRGDKGIVKQLAEVIWADKGVCSTILDLECCEGVEAIKDKSNVCKTVLGIARNRKAYFNQFVMDKLRNNIHRSPLLCAEADRETEGCPLRGLSDADVVASAAHIAEPKEGPKEGHMTESAARAALVELTPLSLSHSRTRRAGPPWPPCSIWTRMLPSGSCDGNDARRRRPSTRRRPCACWICAAPPGEHACPLSRLTGMATSLAAR